MTSDAIIKLRHELHRYPELSGDEKDTAARITQFLRTLAPAQIIEGLGGHGVAAVFGTDESRTIMLRCELDALPIAENNVFAHQSVHSGQAHSCGHDGHMAILVAVAETLAACPPANGRVILLFQPAEETGAGAQAIIDDPSFQALAPDFVCALHNMPGYPPGQVVIRPGTMTAASRGLNLTLSGETAHAAHPETGRSPANALATLMAVLQPLPASVTGQDALAFSTIVGATLGAKTFGTAPAEAQLWVTLRCEHNATMDRIVDYIARQVEQICTPEQLATGIAYEDVFPATVNDPAAVALIQKALTGHDVLVPETPIRWSEDFGHFTARTPGALFGLGAGLEQPDLHHSHYDFPDALIGTGRDVFLAIIDEVLAQGLDSSR